MPSYDYKRIQELTWIAVVAGGTFALQLLVTFDASKIADWQTWAVAAAGGLVRAVAGAVLANIQASQS